MKLAPQINEKTVSEVRNCAVSFSDDLDSGESLTGTPTVIVASPSESPEVLIISDEAINSSQITINGIAVPTGEAAQFKIQGGTVNISYTIRISCVTDSTPAQTLYGNIVLKVIED